MYRNRPVPLSDNFYTSGALEVARNLLGCVLRLQDGDRTLCAGRIVETEAYTNDDPASHSFRRQTARNRSMFLRGGHVYVYNIYGIYRCLNVVTGPAGMGEAVLLRALEPLEGLALMWKQRFGRPMPQQTGPQDKDYRNLCSGPGKICMALGIDVQEFDGTSLETGPLGIDSGPPISDMDVERSPRIGMAAGRGDELPWRFTVKSSPFLSVRSKPS